MISTGTRELPIVTLGIRSETDLVLLRQRARLVAELLDYGPVDQTRIATAVSEIARNALRHGGGGSARIVLAGPTGPGRPQTLEIRIEDSGQGLGPERRADAWVEEAGEAEIVGGGRRDGRGIPLARRLMDDFQVEDQTGTGTAVRLVKRLPSPRMRLGPRDVARLVDELLRRPPESLLEELHQQHQELLALLQDLTAQQEALRATNAELEETNRGVMALYADVARELDETNRGVVALYAQLDEQAGELRGLNALKDRFLSHLSHEFRTPLNAAYALSRLLLGRADGPLTREQEVQVRFIHDAAAELLEMVNDLLDLAKIEAGRMDARPARFDLDELLGALRGMFRPLADAAGLRLRIDPPPPEAATLLTDRGKLAQILRNLLSNAVKYTPKGEVRMTTRFDGGFVVFSVSDTGVGIAEDELESIFEDFVQSGRRRPEAQGTGLGLPLARRLTALLGGTIRAESREGAGSTFEVRIPARSDPSEEPQGFPTQDVEPTP
jgi:signal transduction histidine kinase